MVPGHQQPCFVGTPQHRHPLRQVPGWPALWKAENEAQVDKGGPVHHPPHGAQVRTQEPDPPAWKQTAGSLSRASDFKTDVALVQPVSRV